MVLLLICHFYIVVNVAEMHRFYNGCTELCTCYNLHDLSNQTVYNKYYYILCVIVVITELIVAASQWGFVSVSVGDLNIVIVFFVFGHKIYNCVL